MGTVIRLLLASLGALYLCAVGAAFAGVETIPTNGRNVYRLAVAHVGGELQAIGSTYDNRVCAFSVEGKHLWDAPVGGFVFDLTVADLDGDGRDEIVAACADGFVRVLDAVGKVRWEHDLLAPVLQVCIARLDGKSPMVLAGGAARQVVMFSPAGQLLQTVNLDQGVANAAVRMLRAGGK
jgi:outer membrane protein assembly factor BamB